MDRIRLVALVLGALALASVCDAAGDAAPARARRARPVSDTTRQLVVVTTDGWSATAGTLRRYERAPGGPWRATGEPIAVVLGRAGLGWGRGLHGDGAPPGRPGPIKAEGDGRAPAGVFRLGAIYGYDPAPPAGTQLPYVALGASWRCVDDPASARYNRVLDSAALRADWRSAEIMRRDDELYRRVVVVEHNAAPPRPGGGSCIFLHVQDEPGSTTAGCTAMTLVDLEALIAWLRPGALLVALPASEHAALRARWALPAPRDGALP